MGIIISNNLVLPTEAIWPPFPLTHPRIGYLSICTSDNVVASSAAAGFPATAAINPLTYDQWRPVTSPATFTCTLAEADDCDYMGIAGHNLATVNATVLAEYSTDGTTWVELSSFAPGDNSPIMVLFNATTALAWRLTITWPDADAQPKVGVIKIGNTLQMQRRIYGGHAPVTLNRVTDRYPTRSEGGQFLGHSVIRKGVKTSFEFRHLTPDWYRTFFDPFVKVARSEPFFIAWRPSDYAGEIGYGYAPNDFTPSNMGVAGFMQVSFDFVGITDD